MGNLPSLKPRELLKILKKNGFLEKRQVGSHIQLFHPGKNLYTTIQYHNKDLKKGTLSSILKQANIKLKGGD